MNSAELPTAPQLDRDNPWPGLANFEEQDAAFFHGRQVEGADLLQLLRRELLTVLFGRSGLGKTSLLKASLFPALRGEDFLPVYLRLEHGEDAPPLRQQVLDGLRRACDEHLRQAATQASDESLWAFFHRRGTEFWSRRMRLVTPVLVLDQFEEIFTLGQQTEAACTRSTAFLAELADLVENRPPASLRAALRDDRALADGYDFGSAPVKLVLSLREDFLAELEDWKPSMPSLMHNRLRLLPMDGAQAYAVVCEAGGALVEDAVARRVLLLAWKNQVQPAVEQDEFSSVKIDPALLSVVCSELNHKRRQAGLAVVTPELLDGADKEILKGFYERGLAGLDRRVRVFVEDQLLTAEGYRNTHFLGDALEAVGQETVDKLIARRLLRVDEWQRQRRLELTHDVLAAVVKLSRDGRRVAEQRRRNQRNGFLVLAGVVLLAAMGWGVWRQEMVARATISEARGAKLLAIGGLLSGNQQNLGLLLNMEALRISPSLATRAGLQRSFNSQPHLAAFLPSHHDNILAVAYSPDGTKLASAGEDGSVVVWNAALRSPMLRLEGHQSGATSVTFSPDGTVLASGSGGGSVKQWDLRSGKLLASVATHSGVTALAFSPDGGRLASGSRNGSVAMWHRTGNQALVILKGHSNSVNFIAFSPDGKRLVSGDHDRKLFQWDVTDRKVVTSWPGLSSYVRSGSFSPDGKSLVVGLGDGSITIWDMIKGSHTRTLRGHQGAVNSIAFSLDGMRMVSGGEDRSVRLWDSAGDFREIATMTAHGKAVQGVSFSPDSKWLVSGGEDSALLLWNLTRRTALASTLEKTAVLRAMSFSPDGKLIASGGQDGIILLWDSRNMTVVARLAGHKRWVSSVAFSPDGKLLASSGGDNAVKLWATESGSLLATLNAHKEAVSNITFSPDGLKLASASWDNTVILWEVPRRKKIYTLTGHKDPVNDIAFSPDGKRLASGGSDQSVAVWDVENGTLLARLTGHKSSVDSVTFNVDGTRLAAGGNDGSVLWWDWADNTVLIKLAVGRGAVSSLAVSQDGNWLAAGSTRGELNLWGLNGQAPEHLANLNALQGWVGNVRFSPDGKHLAAAGRAVGQLVESGKDDGGGLAVWDMDRVSLSANACRVANRNLTCAEWHQYIGPDTPYRKTCPELPAPESCK